MKPGDVGKPREDEWSLILQGHVAPDLAEYILRTDEMLKNDAGAAATSLLDSMAAWQSLGTRAAVGRLFGELDRKIQDQTARASGWGIRLRRFLFETEHDTARLPSIMNALERAHSNAVSYQATMARLRSAHDGAIERYSDWLTALGTCMSTDVPAARAAIRCAGYGMEYLGAQKQLALTAALQSRSVEDLCSALLRVLEMTRLLIANHAAAWQMLQDGFVEEKTLLRRYGGKRD